MIFFYVIIQINYLLFESGNHLLFGGIKVNEIKCTTSCRPHTEGDRCGNYWEGNYDSIYANLRCRENNDFEQKNCRSLVNITNYYNASINKLATCSRLYIPRMPKNKEFNIIWTTRDSTIYINFTNIYNLKKLRASVTYMEQSWVRIKLDVDKSLSSSVSCEKTVLYPEEYKFSCNGFGCKTNCTNFSLTSLNTGVMYAIQIDIPRRFLEYGELVLIDSKPQTPIGIEVTNISYTEATIVITNLENNTNCILQIWEDYTDFNTFRELLPCKNITLIGLVKSAGYKIIMRDLNNFYADEITTFVTNTDFTIKLLSKTTVSATFRANFTQTGNTKNKCYAYAVEYTYHRNHTATMTDCRLIEFNSLNIKTILMLVYVLNHQNYSMNFKVSLHHDISIKLNLVTDSAVFLTVLYTPEISADENIKCQVTMQDNTDRLKYEVEKLNSDDCRNFRFFGFRGGNRHVFRIMVDKKHSTDDKRARFYTKKRQECQLNITNISYYSVSFTAKMPNNTKINFCFLSISDDSNSRHFPVLSKNCATFKSEFLTSNTTYNYYLIVDAEIGCMARGTFKTPKLFNRINKLIKITHNGFKFDNGIRDHLDYVGELCTYTLKFPTNLEFSTTIECGYFEYYEMGEEESVRLDVSPQITVNQASNIIITSVIDPFNISHHILQNGTTTFSWIINKRLKVKYTIDFKLIELAKNLSIDETGDKIQFREEGNITFNSVNVDLIIEDIHYYAEVCLHQLESMCLFFDGGYDVCASCSRLYFSNEFPKGFLSIQNVTFSSNSSKIILNFNGLTNKPGFIQSCFISVQIMYKPSTITAELTKPVDGEYLNDNPWYTVAFLDPEACTGSSSYVLGPIYDKATTFPFYRSGYYYNFILTACNSNSCSNSLISDRILIRYKYQSVLTGIFAGAIIIAVTLYVIGLSIVLLIPRNSYDIKNTDTSTNLWIPEFIHKLYLFYYRESEDMSYICKSEKRMIKTVRRMKKAMRSEIMKKSRSMQKRIKSHTQLESRFHALPIEYSLECIDLVSGCIRISTFRAFMKYMKYTDYIYIRERFNMIARIEPRKKVSEADKVKLRKKLNIQFCNFFDKCEELKPFFPHDVYCSYISDLYGTVYIATTVPRTEDIETFFSRFKNIKNCSIVSLGVQSNGEDPQGNILLDENCTTVTYNGIFIKKSIIQEDSDIFIWELNVTEQSNERKIKYYGLKSWPSDRYFGTTSAIIKLQEQIRIDAGTKNVSIVTMCNDGKSKCGSFILYDSNMVLKLKGEEYFKIHSTAAIIRHHGRNMIGSPGDYVLVHRCLEDATD